MKKSIAVFLTLVMILCILPLGAMPVYAATSGISNDCSWSLDGTTLTISGTGEMLDYGNYIYTHGRPDIVDYYRLPWGTAITKVIIKNGVTSIGNFAFRGCNSLKSISIPNSVTTIGHYAFENCSSLTSISIPDGVTSIGEGAFYNTGYYNNSANWKNAALYIGNHLISVKDTISDVCTIKEGTKTIADAAFENCGYLKEIMLPNTVTHIGALAFFNCRNLVSINIPSGVTHIKISTFSYCQNLTKIIIPNSVITIRPHVFNSCSRLKSVTIGNGVKRIGYSAFKDCESLDEVIIYSLDCEFDDTGLNYLQTIYGFKGSTAESLAQGISATFVDVETVHTHKYTNSCDTDCNECGKTRTIKHTYTNACDKACNVCKAQRDVSHSYEKVVNKATVNKDGKINYKCAKCGYVSSKSTTVKRPTSFKLSTTSYTYNGKAKTPTVTVKDSAGKTLKKNTDYTVTYASGRKNVGTYKVTVKMKGNYSGTKTLTFKIKPASTSKCTFKLSTTSYTYNGKAKTPSVTVKGVDGKTLKKNTDYTVTYASGRKNVGSYKVTIKMKGNYTGTKALTFKINPTTTTVSKVTPASKRLKVYVSKKTTQTTGYQIQYSTVKLFSSTKTKTLTKNTTTSTTLTGLKAKTTYYVRVRTYKTVGGVKYYSGWSSARSAKTK